MRKGNWIRCGPEPGLVPTLPLRAGMSLSLHFHSFYSEESLPASSCSPPGCTSFSIPWKPSFMTKALAAMKTMISCDNFPGVNSNKKIKIKSRMPYGPYLPPIVLARYGTVFSMVITSTVHTGPYYGPFRTPFRPGTVRLPLARI